MADLPPYPHINVEKCYFCVARNGVIKLTNIDTGERGKKWGSGRKITGDMSRDVFQNIFAYDCRHDVCRVHEKFFLPIRANWWVLHSIRFPEPKNVSFLLSRHHVRRVHEKFPSRRFERADGCKTHFGLLSPKTFDSCYLGMMYVEFMKNSLLADSSEVIGN